MSPKTKFIRLKKIFEILHGPKGCLWDKKQTHKTLISYLKEETKELAHALRSGNCCHIKEELGDVLLQVMLHAQIASKGGSFDIEDVLDGLIKKIKRRHPHVFGKIKVKSVREIKANWEKIKMREKKDQTKNPDFLGAFRR
ncbi:MAG: MazG nucleotide pyrophosphohydrolase domain-containing protein [Candidatus Omnitrophota bacterium]|nr:MazG nucleotide pyrophosphohydrolase domain-containing protein [Candidatus Omnitrophota bacterium]